MPLNPGPTFPRLKYAKARTAETVDARIKAEKLKQYEILTRKQKMEELTRHGKWLLASDVAGEYEPPGRGNGPDIRGRLPDFASAAAAKFQIPQRDVLHLLRSEFEKAREQFVAAGTKSE